MFVRPGCTTHKVYSTEIIIYIGKPLTTWFLEILKKISNTSQAK